MIYYELTLFIKFRKKPICTAIFENKALLDNFINSLSASSDFVRLGDIIFKKDEICYMEVKEKEIKK